VVLIHFPIALYLSATMFDVCGRVFRKSGLAEVARWNFLFAAVMSIPAAATGVLAWQWALEGKHLEGILLLRLLLAPATVIGLWVTVWLRSWRKKRPKEAAPVLLLLIEAGVCSMVGLSAHLGGFLSGVNTGT